MKTKRFLCQLLLLTFLLGVKDGFITLWQDGKSEPIRIFPYRADVLPPEDQKRLREGIKIDSKTELLHLLEDYLS